jgi:hypothetical protein
VRDGAGPLQRLDHARSSRTLGHDGRSTLATKFEVAVAVVLVDTGANGGADVTFTQKPGRPIHFTRTLQHTISYVRARDIKIKISGTTGSTLGENDFFAYITLSVNPPQGPIIYPVVIGYSTSLSLHVLINNSFLART